MRLEYNGDEILDIKEAAKLLNVSSGTFRKWIKNGIIPYWRTSENGPYRFFRGEILDVFRNRGKKH